MNRNIPLLLATTALTITSCTSFSAFNNKGCGETTNIIKKEIVNVELDLTDQYATAYLIHTYSDGEYNIFETTQELYDKIEPGAACILIERDNEDIDDLTQYIRVAI